MRVAVLGMGNMGSAVATRLAGNGHAVTVWNRSPGKAGEAVSAGAREAGSIADALAGAEVVITSLSNDEAVREVMLGAGGVRESHEQAARTPGGVLVADASTISPALSAELASAIERFVAMPILGAPSAVREGRATYLVGAPAELAARLEPLLGALAATTLHFPSAPLASSAKLASNLVLLVGLTALAEGIAAARAGGLSDAQVEELFGDSPVVAPGLRNRLGALLSGESPGWWSVDLGRKDARLVSELAAAGGQQLPVTAAARARYDEASAEGLGDKDIARVIELYR